MEKLEKYLNKKYGKGTEEYTHTSFNGGKWNIPITEIQELHKEIIKRTERGEECNIIERIIKNSKNKIIMMDLDFRFNKHKKTNITEEIERNVVRLVIDSIKEIMEIGEEKYTIFVMEKEGAKEIKNKEYVSKEGMHIIIPDVKVGYEEQYRIREEMIRRWEEYVRIENEIQRPEQIIDKAVIEKNGWILYKCSKKGEKPYKIKTVYDNENNEQEYEGEDIDIIDILSYNYTENDETIKILKGKRREEKKEKIEKPKIIKKKENTMEITREKEEVRRLIKMINTNRADDYEEWTNMCWILRSISDDEEMYKIFTEFSKKSKKYDEGECEKLWKTNKGKDKKTIASLHWLAKKDNNTEYNKNRTLEEYINYSLSGTTYDIANVMYQKYKEQYVCTSANGKEWFEFRDHRWHQCEGGISLRKKISNEINEIYNDLIKRETDNDKVKILNEITCKLRDQPFKEKLMKECVTLFYISNWTKKLDSNLMLISFENGIYELDNNKFRDGKPEDLISISTGKKYTLDINIPEGIIDEIQTFLTQIIPMSEVKHFVLKVLASFLQGNNPDEKFHVWTGVGGNGKSKLLELLENTLGEYAGKLSISMLTEKRPNSTVANPELARTRGKRICTFQEPDEGARINIGLLKELTGGDKIICRGLFKEPFEMKPQFKLLLCCNHKPKVPPDEESTWRRLLIVEFISKFVKNPQGEYEYKRNDNLSTEKIPEWSNYFINILLKYYYKYKEEGLNPPQEVINSTNEYKLETDEYLQFIKEHLIEDKNNIIKLDEIYNVFTLWYNSNYAPQKVKSRKEFKMQMEKKFKQPYYSRVTNGGWMGWKINLFNETKDIKQNETKDIKQNQTPMDWMVQNTEEGNDDEKVPISECIVRYNEETKQNISPIEWGKLIKYKQGKNKFRYYKDRKWKNIE